MKQSSFNNHSGSSPSDSFGKRKFEQHAENKAAKNLREENKGFSKREVTFY